MHYELNLLGMKRNLPILKAPSGIYIAGFNPVGDIELLVKSAEELVKIVKLKGIEYDVVLTTELKGVCIAQEVSRNLKCDYVCLRKGKKSYMEKPKSISSSSITSGSVKYYISSTDLEKLKNKKVLFVDDVFSTGSTFTNMIKLAKREKFQIVAGLSILKEGDDNLEFKYKSIPVYCCGFLPLPNVEKE